MGVVKLFIYGKRIRYAPSFNNKIQIIKCHRMKFIFPRSTVESALLQILEVRIHGKVRALKTFQKLILY